MGRGWASLVVPRFKVGAPVVGDLIISISNIQYFNIAHVYEFIESSFDGVLRKCDVSLHSKVDIQWAQRKGQRVVGQERKDCLPPRINTHAVEFHRKGSYLHRKCIFAELIGETTGYPSNCRVYRARFKTPAHHLVTTDRRDRAHITTYLNGPNGPAVGASKMMKHNDRTKAYDGGGKSPADSTNRLPDEDEHKRQLQRIVGNHPMSFEIREQWLEDPPR